MFRIGDTVIYPQHGAAVVERFQEREVSGEVRKYMVLRVTYGDLTLMVPADSTREVGLRPVTPAEQIDDVLGVLSDHACEEPTANWSRRFKANIEKLASGDIFSVAEVVRDLTSREHDRGLSAGEKRMLSRARQILVSELCITAGCGDDKAMRMIDDVLEA
ncbi:MAG: CarD family transcriptional regulator [Actinomycetota bacterium]